MTEEMKFIERTIDGTDPVDKGWLEWYLKKYKDEQVKKALEEQSKQYVKAINSGKTIRIDKA